MVVLCFIIGVVCFLHGYFRQIGGAEHQFQPRHSHSLYRNFGDGLGHRFGKRGGKTARFALQAEHRISGDFGGGNGFVVAFLLQSPANRTRIAGGNGGQTQRSPYHYIFRIVFGRIPQPENRFGGYFHHHRHFYSYFGMI